MAILPEVMKSHREALEHWARLYESDGGPGTEQVAMFLKKAANVMGRVLKDPSVPAHEPRPKEASIEEVPADTVTG